MQGSKRNDCSMGNDQMTAPSNSGGYKRNTEVRLTHRWREMDSNHRYPEINHRFETDFCRFHDGSVSERAAKGFTSFATGDRHFESGSLQRRVSNEQFLTLGVVWPVDTFEVVEVTQLHTGLWRQILIPQRETVNRGAGDVADEENIAGPEGHCAGRLERTRRARR